MSYGIDQYINGDFAEITLEKNGSLTVVVGNGQDQESHEDRFPPGKTKELYLILKERFEPKPAPSISWTTVNNDVNGNPRYVCHYTDLLKDGETGYETGLANSRQFGGRKFHNKQYGGGIVFQSYNRQGLEKKILEFTGKI